jgi:hypothetical protein
MPVKSKLREIYRSLRAQHPTAGASTLITWARSTLKRKPLDWHNDRHGMPRCEWEADGFKLVAIVGNDEYGTVDWLGEFHDREVSGAQRVHAPGLAQSDRHGCVWYRPACTYAEHYRGLRSLNFSRDESDRLARGYIKSDVDRLRSYANGDLSLVCVGVTASRAGVDLGFAALHGIDVDSPTEPYITEVALEIAADALHEAKAKLAELCPNKRKAA